MKVIHVITKSNWGGAQKYVHALATGMPAGSANPGAANTPETLVILGGNGLLKAELERAGVRVISLPGLERDIDPMGELGTLLELTRIFQKEKPSVIHLNSSKIGGIGALAGRIAGVPKIIFTAHGWAFNEDRPPLQKSATAVLSWMTALLCHKVIVLSRKEELQTLKMPLVSRRKVAMIRLGISPVSLEERNHARAELARDAKIDPSALWIGNIAELHRNKGIEYALQALGSIAAESSRTASSSLPPFAFIVLGEGEERQRLEATIAECGLEGKAFLLGFVKDASKYLSAFDLFLFTSAKEGLPYALLEAASAGLPVIASAVGGIPEIIEDGKSGALVPAKDVAKIAEKLELLMKNPSLRQQLGKALHDSAAAEFNIDKMRAETYALYVAR